MPMDAELAALEDRVNTLAMLCQHLRQENHQLRQELAVSRSEGEKLAEKINATKSRLDMLIAKLPLEEVENIE